jgi:hypothetical protein
MEGSLRPATSGEIVKTLSALFVALPPRKGKFDDLVDAYQIALNGCSYAGLKTTVFRAMRGEVEGLSETFGPTPPELAKAVRETDRSLRRIAEINARPDVLARALLTIEQRQDDAKARMAKEGRAFIGEIANVQNLNREMKRLNVPPGALYVAILGAFYGPATITPEEQMPGPYEVEQIRQREAIKRMNAKFQADHRASLALHSVDSTSTMDARTADYWRRVDAVPDRPNISEEEMKFRRQIMAKVEQAEQQPQPEGIDDDDGAQPLPTDDEGRGDDDLDVDPQWPPFDSQQPASEQDAYDSASDTTDGDGGATGACAEAG